MKNKKIMALILAATMLIGSSVTAFAEDANSAQGSGTLLPHVDREITAVTLPTTTAVADVFNYTLDPEGLIMDSGHLSDNTEVTGNADGVYFKNKDNTYSSSSDAVQFEGKNSVDVDVTVEAAVVAGANDITLVADETALNSATTPALLMTLKVGSEEKAITSAGTEATAKIDGVAGNFEVKVADGKHVYAVKDAATGWKSTTVQLSGKTNSANVPVGGDALTAPTIKLTWTVAKHPEAPTEVSITSGATAVVAGSEDASAGITHVAAVTKGTDTNIAIGLPTGNTIKGVYVAGSIAGLSNNTANADRAAVSGDKVVIKGNSDWTNVAGTKYAKIVVGTSAETTKTYIVKINISVD